VRTAERVRDRRGGLTGRGLAAAESAAFKNHSSWSAECPAYMYVFHNSKEISAGGYTVGAVILDHGILGVYTADVTSAPEFVVSY
jgi:hypothetical protein